MKSCQEPEVADDYMPVGDDQASQASHVIEPAPGPCRSSRLAAYSASRDTQRLRFSIEALQHGQILV